MRALFFLATVCDEGRTFADTKSARMRLVDWGSGAEICRYVPATKARCAVGARVCTTLLLHPLHAHAPTQGAHTALFVARVARGMGGTDWHLSTIGEVDHTARDFGSLGALTHARTHARTHAGTHARTHAQPTLPPPCVTASLQGPAAQHAIVPTKPHRAAAHQPTIPRPHGHLAVPEIKAYMQDIVPGVRVDPEERIVLLRKGGVVRP